ncbi:AI-2E family transporter [Pelistega suis]|uniref:AI-2E family transporter n=1 Tax=Pelistega suis TaxID=1631957 RepID=UPI00211B836C|nr:AI-2E family transporter [Pelistega suis]MCQ9328810.1 AI-2E family transporter [Pelistega suis]
MQNKNRVFYAFYIGFLLLISVGFLYLLSPYFSAIFWGIIFAVLFKPVYNRILKLMPKRRNVAAVLTLLIAILVAFVPLSLITASLTKEVVTLYNRVQSGELNLGLYADHIFQNLPGFIKDILERYQIDSVFGLRDKIMVFFNNASRLLATELVSFSQNTFSFLISVGIMMYLLFFFIRDGSSIQGNLTRLVPLSYEHKVHLFEKFITVVRATVKGNMLVAVVQGALGGFIFALLGIQGALLWGVIMAFLSLLPAVGAAIIWFPVAIYFLVSGSYWEGGILIAYGFCVIGLADNLLRPMLVGKDTKLPDYLVLISTLGGLTAFGINGFVIGPLLAALFIAFWDELPNAVGLLEPLKPQNQALAQETLCDHDKVTSFVECEDVVKSIQKTTKNEE